MQLHFWLAAAALVPSLASAAIFPKDTLVKMLDAKGFKAAMKANETSVVAFVAPWCGHCQRMAPEYSRAALGVYPMVPFYAVDCDKKSNKELCAAQGVQGFPTVKLFPRGGKSKPIDFDGPSRTASAFYYFASRNIPHNVKKIYQLEDIPAWIEENKAVPRALLLNQAKHIPLLWQTLGNKYKGQIKFSVHRDRRGKSSVKMGLEKGEPKSSKVLVYPPGSSDFVLYEGIQKHDSLSKFFDSVLDGTADLKLVNAAAAQEEFVPDEKELEIERQQEAQRIALAHGGFTDLIDFEEAIKNGAGADYHEKHGYPGMMGGGMPKKKADGQDGAAADAHAGADEDMIRKILKHSQEAEAAERNKPKMAKTDDAQVAFKAETGHAKTPVAGEAAAATAAAEKREAAGADDEAEDAVPIPAHVGDAEAPAPAEGAQTKHASDEL